MNKLNHSGYNGSSNYPKKISGKICGNCGEKGHIYKTCNGPVTSIGIIAFRKKSSDRLKPKFQNYLGKYTNDPENIQLKVLLIQRKDSIGYIDFIRGKYPKNSKNTETVLLKYLNEMTDYEIQRLQTNTFNDLWNDLWSCKTNKFFIKEKKDAQLKFESLDIPRLITKFNNSYTGPHWQFTELGIPKGRRNTKENEKECAMREFEEETGYLPEHYNLLDELGSIQENFTGSNGIEYRHIYYYARVHNHAPDPQVLPKNKEQLKEISDIGWFSFDEAFALIRNYNLQRKMLIENAFKTMLMYEKFPHWIVNRINEFNGIKRM